MIDYNPIAFWQGLVMIVSGVILLMLMGSYIIRKLPQSVRSFIYDNFWTIVFWIFMLNAGFFTVGIVGLSTGHFYFGDFK